MYRRSPLIGLADSHLDSLTAMRRQLEDAGYTVHAASSGEDVILLCDIETPDILLIDIGFADLDGYEVVESVRHETRDYDVAIIIMAEIKDNMTRAYFGQMVDFAGGDYFIAKPCDMKVLLRLLDSLAREIPGARAGRYPASA